MKRKAQVMAGPALCVRCQQRVLKPRLIAIFIGVAATGILLFGYLSNAVI